MRSKLVRIMTDRHARPTLHLANLARMDEDVEEQRSQIRVTNRNSKYKLEHGSQFKQMLEPRDQILEHEFDFTIPIDKQEIGRRDFKFPGSQLYWDILNRIRRFLAEATSNVTSVAFKFLCQGDLIEKEAKDYAAKNILLNINSIFLKTVTALEKNPVIREKLSEEILKEIKQTLAIESDYLLSTILLNLTDYYPQAPASGGTPRMREAILDINRVQEEENDLIYANGIKIKDYINNQKGDYTQFIMEVINTAIRVVGSSEGDERQRTIKEIYTQFNEKLFTLVEQDGYRTFIENLDQKEPLPKDSYKSKSPKEREKILIRSDDGSSKRLNPDSTQSKARQSIAEYFAFILETNRATLKAIEEQNQARKNKYNYILQQLKRGDEHHLKPEDVTDPEFQFQNVMNKAEASAEGQKRDKKFVIGQKIPAYVKEFNQQQMRNSEFQVKHSSILRIMTKWAEYLEEIFQKPEKVAYQRLYPFKTLDNNLVYIDQTSWTGAQNLVTRLKDHYLEVDQKHKDLQRQCYAAITDILSQNNEGHGNVARYSTTRTVASKINAVLTFFMIKYLTLLIHHLLQAGRSIWSGTRYHDLNLVVFRVADLMRSKFECTEAQFVGLLRTMYVLDSSDSMKGKFKLVRIKNKLDTPANNIIINYLFMGKVQCQLQLSIQEPKGKEKNYYIFSHFVYELTRGKFGPLAECAIMISQLDPMVVASRGNYYLEKKAHPGPLSSMAILEKEKQSRQRQLESAIREETEKETQLGEDNPPEINSEKPKRNIFNCNFCRRMIINEPREMFMESKGQLCNQCRIKSKNPEKHIKDATLKEFLLNALESREPCLRRLFKWQEFKINFEQYRKRHKIPYLPIAVFSQMGQLELNIAVYLQSQLRSILVRVDQQILDDFAKTSFDFSCLDAVDLGKLMNKQKEDDSYAMIYMIKSLPAVLNAVKLQEESINERLLNFVQHYMDFRLEKKIVKSLRAKSEIINCIQKPKYIEKLGIIIDSGTNSSLKYKNLQEVDFSPIKQFLADGALLSHIPGWLPKFRNLKSLNLVKNKIESIEVNDLPLQLAEINLQNNQIKSVSLPMLANLKVLTLNNNQISSFSFNHDLPNLRELVLNRNKLRSICFDHELPSLVNLSLEVNKLKQISFSHDLPNLRVINLSFNDLPSIAFNQSFPSLEQILITSNQLTSISFTHPFPKLKRLFLDQNQLSQVRLKAFPALKIAYLNQNKLVNVQFEEDLPSLIQLYLQENQLESLSLGHDFASLKLLIVSSNKLASITLAQPIDLKILGLDAQLAAHFDFAQFPGLDNLRIYQGRVEKDRLQNFRDKTVIQYV